MDKGRGGREDDMKRGRERGKKGIKGKEGREERKMKLQRQEITAPGIENNSRKHLHPPCFTYASPHRLPHRHPQPERVPSQALVLRK